MEQSLVYFLANHPNLNDWELNDYLSREDVFFIIILLPWEMYFDEATR